MTTDFKKIQKAEFMDYITGKSDVVPLMYAVDPKDVAWVDKIVPGLVIESAGGLWPLEVTGKLKGYQFYYRERHGAATLDVGTEDPDPSFRGYVGDQTVLYRSSIQHGENKESEWFSTLLKLIELLEPAYDYPYMFSTYKAEYVKDDSGEVVELKMSEKANALNDELGAYFAQDPEWEHWFVEWVDKGQLDQRGADSITVWAKSEDEALEKLRHPQSTENNLWDLYMAFAGENLLIEFPFNPHLNCYWDVDTRVWPEVPDTFEVNRPTA